MASGLRSSLHMRRLREEGERKRNERSLTSDQTFASRRFRRVSVSAAVSLEGKRFPCSDMHPVTAEEIRSQIDETRS